jgi:phage/plasmid-associated DNA primase
MDGYDPDMERKLAAEDVLARGALCGLLALPGLIERGRFVEIPEMQAELDSVLVDNNSVARWVDDACIDSASLDRRTVAEVYKAYRDWADEAGEKFVRNRSEFSKALIDYLGLTRVHSGMLVTTKMKLNGSVVRAYKLVHSAKIDAKG